MTQPTMQADLDQIIHALEQAQRCTTMETRDLVVAAIATAEALKSRLARERLDPEPLTGYMGPL
jgi:hypothetical protein